MGCENVKLFLREPLGGATIILNILFGTLLTLVIIFVFQNMEVVEVTFLSWKISTSRALILLLTFLVGVVFGWLARRPKRQ